VSGAAVGPEKVMRAPTEPRAIQPIVSRIPRDRNTRCSVCARFRHVVELEFRLNEYQAVLVNLCPVHLKLLDRVARGMA